MSQYYYLHLADQVDTEDLTCTLQESGVGSSKKRIPNF
jgi:hypothetical protein